MHAQERLHSVPATFEGRLRSKTDLIHSFIPRLKMDDYRIKRVAIFEGPIRAKIIFRKTEPHLSHVSGLSRMFRRKQQETHHEFTLHINIHDQDIFGFTYFLDYRLDVQELHVEEKRKASNDIHHMIKNAHGISQCFSVAAV